VNSIHPWVVDMHMGRRSPRMLQILAENPSYAGSLGKVVQEPAALEPQDVSAAIL
jgi:hypothetical protein